LVNSIGEELSASAARAIVQNLLVQGTVSQEAAGLLGAALSDRAYRDVPVDRRERLRAALMKQMLTALVL
ncbi:MAG: CtsR family transcriptional regulator, partial [Clostridiales bacterium]|nr:CtsR family transcriptional regulator [Clostridiales bacterium]